MQQKPVITADALAPDSMDAAARPLPDRVHHAGPLVGASAEGDATMVPPEKSVWRSALRWLRDGAIGLAIITTIPLVAVGMRGNMLQLLQSDLGTRIEQVQTLRELRLPTTSELSPLAAGQLWHGLEIVEGDEAFPTQAASPPAERSWRSASFTDDMFEGISWREHNVPQSSDILWMAGKGLSEAERAYLRVVANAPIWRDIDRVASAAAVDIVGARFVLPFRADATPLFAPVPSFSATREIAHAGLARAAFHLAQGEPDRAEHALRSVLSYGFVLLDNGTTTIEGLVGRVVVGIARDGLHALYTITGNEVGAALTVPIAEPKAATPRIRVPLTEERLIEIALDPAAPRMVRLESLRDLAFNSCSNVRGALFGPSPESKAAFDNARRTLARYPSEVALLDLMQDVLNRPLGSGELDTPGDRMLMGAASVASTVLHTPHIQTCTRVLSAFD